MDDDQDRITEKTTNFRWVKNTSTGEKVLQQQFKESDECWVDWQGNNPIYWWEDVPEEIVDVENEER